MILVQGTFYLFRDKAWIGKFIVFIIWATLGLFPFYGYLVRIIKLVSSDVHDRLPDIGLHTLGEDFGKGFIVIIAVFCLILVAMMPTIVANLVQDATQSEVVGTLLTAAFLPFQIIFVVMFIWIATIRYAVEERIGVYLEFVPNAVIAMKHPLQILSVLIQLLVVEGITLALAGVLSCTVCGAVIFIFNLYIAAAYASGYLARQLEIIPLEAYGDIKTHDPFE